MSLKNATLCLTLMSTPFASANAQVVALVDACKTQGMKPYPALNEHLGPGSLYLNGGGYPTSANLICDTVFSGLPNAGQTAIASTVMIGTQSGTVDKEGKLGISFLKGLLGTGNDAKIDAGLARGTKWELKTDRLTTHGQTQLGLIRLKLNPGPCLQEFQKSLGKKKSLNVMLLFQSAQASELSYSVKNTRNANAGIGINLAELISINPSYTIKKSSDSVVTITGKPVNVCYVWKKYRLSADSIVGPGNFILTGTKT